MFLCSNNNNPDANVSKFLLKAVKLVVWAGALIYIVYRLINFPGEQYFNWVINVQTGNAVFFTLLTVCFLSIINWGLESFKWQILAGRLQNISFARSFKGVLLGVAMGMVTPKRLGEFAGRVVVLDKDNRVEGAIINAAGTMCQLLVTLVAGSISMFILFNIKNTGSIPGFYFNEKSVIIPVVLLSLAAIIYICRRRVTDLFMRSKWLGTLCKKLLILKKVSRVMLFRLLLLSFLRYVVFMTQCFLLFRLVGLSLSLPEAFLFQSVVFLFMTILPVTAFSELAVKGGLAIFLFGHIFAGSISNYYGFEISLILANGLLWLINLAIPALAGVVWGMEYGLSFKKQFV